MNNRKMRFALVTAKDGELQVIRQAATREKLEREQARLQPIVSTTLTIVPLESILKTPHKVEDRLQAILTKLEALSEAHDTGNGHAAADALLLDALKILAGRHGETVYAIVDAWSNGHWHA